MKIQTYIDEQSGPFAHFLIKLLRLWFVLYHQLPEELVFLTLGYDLHILTASLIGLQVLDVFLSCCQIWILVSLGYFTTLPYMYWAVLCVITLNNEHSPWIKLVSIWLVKIIYHKFTADLIRVFWLL